MTMTTVVGLILLCFIITTVTSDCSSCSPQSYYDHSIPVILQNNVSWSVLHSKCYAMCTNEILGAGDDDFLNCATVQQIESCRIGCVLQNKGENDCLQKCNDEQNNSTIIDWSTVYTVGNQCTQNYNKESCTIGCSVNLDKNTKDINLIVSRPKITYINSWDERLQYTIDMSSPFSNSSHDLRIAMVIEIMDTNTSRTYYKWVPKLVAPIDLTHFACHEVILRVKIIYGNSSLTYSPPISMCIEPIQHCNIEVNSASDEKLITELNDKITELQNKIARVLQLIQPLTIFKSTKGLDQIEAILEEITSIVNQK